MSSRIAKLTRFSLALAAAGSALLSQAAWANPGSCSAIFLALSPHGDNVVNVALNHIEIDKSLTSRFGNTRNEMNWETLNLPDGAFQTLIAPAKPRAREPEPNPQSEAVALPRVSLSLENGRQKLNVVRIHFARGFPQESVAVLNDYLSAAMINKDLRIFVMTDEAPAQVEAIVRKAPKGVRDRVRVGSVEAYLEPWSQDGSKPVDLPASTLDLNQGRYESVNQAAQKSGPVTLVKGLTFRLQGGDIIVGDRNVFVGDDEIKAVERDLNVYPDEAVRILTRLFNKPVLPVYLKTEPDFSRHLSFHIDLDFVLAVNRRTNKEVALVHSPELMLSQLSGAPLPRDPSQVIINEIRLKILNRYRSGHFGRKLASGSEAFIEVLGELTAAGIQTMISDSKLMKRTLESYGYETVEIPGFGTLDSNFAHTQSYFFGTNAVLSGAYAMIPNNRMPELDREIEAIYSGLGYQVIPMKSSAITIKKQGGIRCASETYRKCYVTITAK